MIILKIIEWLGSEREKSSVSLWDVDLIFMTVIGAIVGIIFFIDKVI